MVNDNLILATSSDGQEITIKDSNMNIIALFIDLVCFINKTVNYILLNFISSQSYGNIIPH